jgi:ribosomal protein L7/L12
MEAINWPWAVGIIVWTLLVFRLGMSIGRMAKDAESIEPIDEARIRMGTRMKIDDALRRGAKIEAIKILREDTGCGLAEAKKTVEAMQPKLN